MVSTFLISARDRGEWSASCPCRSTFGERAPCIHCIRDWVGPRAGLDDMEKGEISYTHQESNSDTTLPLRIKYLL
jgi:hypothetical protein